MRQTLFLIPHDVFGIPIFGIGWGLAIVVLAMLVRAGWAIRSGRRLGELIAAEGLMGALAIGAVVFVLPAIELKNLAGDPVGTAVRGYGAMLLLAVAASVWLAAVRARRYGLDPESIYAVAPWAFFGGIIGARLFYIIQYRDRFLDDSIGGTLANMLKFTEGGLVVYGAFIGGGLAVAFFLIRNRLSLLTFGDVIVPCLFIGVFFGRLGCLANGCCWGGACADGPLALEFPPTSPVYARQLADGDLLGVELSTNRTVKAVRGGSLADELRIRPGQRLGRISAEAPRLDEETLAMPADSVRRGIALEVDGRTIHVSPERLPATALPVYPAQVISSLGGLSLCLLLCWLSRWTLPSGALMCTGFIGYAVLRFGLEIVRVDEGGQFGTSLSISQWVSVIVFFGGTMGLIAVIQGHRRGRIESHASA